MSQKRFKRKRKLERKVQKYRNNVDLFCEEILGIKLYWYQKILLKIISKKEGFLWNIKLK